MNRCILILCCLFFSNFLLGNFSATKNKELKHKVKYKVKHEELNSQMIQPTKVIENYLQHWLGSKDTVLLFNYKTGRVLYAHHLSEFDNRFPIGSVFKVISTFFFLKTNKDAKRYHYNCHAKEPLYCWKKEGHGRINLKDAFIHSCNRYYYSLNLDLKELENQAKMFGLNIKLDQLKNKNRVLALAGNYQGIQANMYELATLISIFANHGQSVDIKKEQEHDYKIWETDLLEEINDYMFQVIQRGTAQKVAYKHYRLSGKTGTAKNNKGHLSGIFIGFMREKPYGVIVHLHQNIGSAAAMIASDVLYLFLK